MAETRIVQADTLANGPVIEIWYGNSQQFSRGTPQHWVNILGTVSDPDGVASLTYRLNNGSPQNLSMGPDTRRLAKPGEFIVEIDRQILIDGANQVRITATDSLGNESTETVTFSYNANAVWPLPDAINWNTTTNIQSVAQVVDGRWSIVPGGVRPDEMRYDAVLAIGDLTWTDYEVVVPVTIHAAQPDPRDGAAVGVSLRWTGHTNNPIVCPQPRCGWLLNGATAWYDLSAPASPLLKLQADATEVGDPSVTLVMDETYYWKIRVETLPPSQSILQSRYFLKVWQTSQPEPASWNVTMDTPYGFETAGSVILIAHNADVTFGNLTVVPLSGGAYTLAVTTVGNGVVTANPDKALYNHGEQVTLTAVSASGWQFGGWSGDATGATPPLDLTMNSDKTITAGFVAQTSTIESDDFNTCTLAPFWTYIPGLPGDPAPVLNGTQLALTTPAGTNHDIWTLGTFSQRVMQSINDTDFEVEVKFDSTMANRYQMRGVLVEDNAGDVLRFEVYHNGTDYILFAASIVGAVPEVKHGQVILGGNPAYMRVKREADTWTHSYSLDGNTWVAYSFDHPWDVVKIGPYAGNAADTPGDEPEHTAIFDYFYNLAAPGPGDSPAGPNSLTIHTSGSGAVARTPDQAGYGCNQEVSLSATPAAGWQFSGWSGDATGSANPLELTMDSNKTVTATFVPITHTLTVNVVGSGAVTATPNKAAYDDGEQVSLSATPAAGWQFSGWSGDATGSANPLVLTMDSDKTVTATFVPITHTLTVNVTGSGAVTATPNKAAYDDGEGVSLSATPAAGWQFSGWSGDATGSANPLVLTMDSNKTITATFVPITHTLTVNVTGSGAVTATPNKAAYDDGEGVSLSATPAAGWQFSGWSGDATGSANPLVLTMDSDKTVTATFTEIPTEPVTYTLTVNVTGSGAVTATPNKAAYDDGEGVSLSATPAAGWQFSGWSGDATGSANPLVLTMDSDKTVTATFTEIPTEPVTYTLTVNVVGSGAVTATPNKAAYDDGEGVSLSAVPALGWQFSGWSGDATGSANPLVLTMDSNKTVTATFTEIPTEPVTYTLTVNVVGSGAVTATPNKAAYDDGEGVSLSATPAAGWQFSGWSGDATGSANPLVLTMDSDKTVTATFTEIPTGPVTYTLTVNVVGSGAVTATPNKAAYDDGEQVSLSATPAAGWQFSGWSGDATGSANPLVLTMNGNKTVTATFTEVTAPTLYTLTVNVVGSGTVTVTPNKGTYHPGEEVSLAATAATGWQFSGWSGDATGAVNSTMVIMDGNKVVTATFVEVQSQPLTYTVEISVSGFGSVVVDRPGPYTAGEVITLTAVPALGWAFSGWHGALFEQQGAQPAEQNPITVTVQGDSPVIQITAHFAVGPLYLPIVVRQ